MESLLLEFVYLWFYNCNKINNYNYGMKLYRSFKTLPLLKVLLKDIEKDIVQVCCYITSKLTKNSVWFIQNSLHSSLTEYFSSHRVPPEGFVVVVNSFFMSSAVFQKVGIVVVDFGIVRQSLQTRAEMAEERFIKRILQKKINDLCLLLEYDCFVK